MTRSKIKNYAPQARRDFIQAVTDRAAYFGLTPTNAEPVKEKGDSVLIGGRAFARKVGEQRKRLEERIRQHGFQQTMEALAYTWFNRLVAIRFMELHDYLDHGYRVLSSRPATETHGKDTEEIKSSNSSFRVSSVSFRGPEILEHAEHVTLESLDKHKVIDLKLDGTKEVELYRLLLIAECNALNAAMPFLFERIDDETELVLPDNLLHSDSLIRKLVNEIDEEDWQQVEIIGWLYQFYISEKKDEVIGKVVASEDIPAATQLFTPNWIVKYLVQNTLGRMWLEHHPDSPLKAKMKYYIEPAEQTSEVQAQLQAIIQNRATEGHGRDTEKKTKNLVSSSVSLPCPSVADLSLNPELLTLLDPACGSGHILVEAYDLFKAIYQERGYRAKDIPRLILQKNLFGLEIDDRAAQLAAFALMMKARADDRRIFTSETKPNVLAMKESKSLDARDITAALNAPILKEKLPPSDYLLEEIEDEEHPLFSRKALSEEGHVSQADVAILLELFEDAKTFGSLIQVPPKLAENLPPIEQRLRDVLKHGDLSHATAGVIAPLLQQARLLATQYDAVVANPPYMGSNYFTERLKGFVGRQYKEVKTDLYACFIRRNLVFAKTTGFVGMITIPNWMFLSSFESIREALVRNQTIDTFIHNGRGVFGSDFGSCSFILRNHSLPQYRSVFRRLFDKQGSVASNQELEKRFHCSMPYMPSMADFARIPGKPIAYWIPIGVLQAFKNPKLGTLTKGEGKNVTANNDRFLRRWWEVACDKVGRGAKWLPYAKGGDFRKWAGNLDFVCDWSPEARQHYKANPASRIIDSSYWYLQGITWTVIATSGTAFRFLPPDTTFDTKGLSLFFEKEADILSSLALLNSVVGRVLLSTINPTPCINIIDVKAVPVVPLQSFDSANVQSLIDSTTEDWNAHETSLEFDVLPMLNIANGHSIASSLQGWEQQCSQSVAKVHALEISNNRFWIDAYGLQDVLSPDISDDQITLYRSDRLEDTKRLLSYAIGCMMGRYSLDKPGLIYAHSGNVAFDRSQYKTFPADDDGIVPLLEADWGIRDDAANRIVEFIGTVWPRKDTEETRKKQKNRNSDSVSLPCPSVADLDFIEQSLGMTIRRYLATGFYKDHLRWYKRRPIYWLFSSGKQRAFQCLVYLHRYHEGTLARMRTEYVIPLQSKIAARIEQLEGDKNKATSTSHRKKLQKAQDDLKKQQTELFAFDEKLKHAADQKIALDLEDGVKVNYGKFGDLLAEVKAVCGTKEED